MARLNDDEREDLVAYLDGELDEARARTLEARLSLDPQARAEADALQQAWGMLDYLPRVDPSPSFTHRTLEKLALQTSNIALPAWRRWAAVAGWAAAVVLAATGGLFAARLLWPQPPVAPEVEEQLVRHLRVIDKLHLYEQAEDIDFLRALDQPELFGDDPDS